MWGLVLLARIPRIPWLWLVLEFDVCNALIAAMLPQCARVYMNPAALCMDVVWM